MRRPLCLLKAIVYWRSGRPIPLDVEAELMALGFDVPTLERQYA